MTGAGKAAAGFAVFFLGMVMLKDGVFTKVINDGAAFLRDVGTGIRPITKVG